jgi:hypothetical protein
LRSGGLSSEYRPRCAAVANGPGVGVGGFGPIFGLRVCSQDQDSGRGLQSVTNGAAFVIGRTAREMEDGTLGIGLGRRSVHGSIPTKLRSNAGERQRRWAIQRDGFRLESLAAKSSPGIPVFDL